MTARARIVLYFPRLEGTRTGLGAERDVLPLPLLTIAAFPHRDGHEVIVLDGNLYDDADSAHRAAVDACEGATIFGTSSILGKQVSDSVLCARAVRARHPRLVSIAGGWFPSVVPEMHLETGLWDAVCLGQGELTFREFVDAVVSGADLEGVNGLALPRDGGVVYTDHRPVVGWDQLLGCPWELIDFEPYRRAQLAEAGDQMVERMAKPVGHRRGQPFVAISYFASFGCPEPCTFCCSPEVTGQRWKAMPAERMLDDLEDLRGRWEFDVVRFVDANWAVAQKRVREFCAGKIERDLDFQWGAMMQSFSVLRAKSDTLDLMRDSGCCLSQIGAETGAEDTMVQLIGKHTAGDDNLHAAIEMDRRGIPSYLTYIVGLPGESEASMHASIDQARRIQATCPTAAAQVLAYLPIPGAASYREALELGFQPPTDLLEWGEFTDYREADVWPGNVPGSVLRRMRLYHHFASLSKGVTRGRRGVWERRAQRRLVRGDWRLARVEAKAFDLWWRLERSLA